MTENVVRAAEVKTPHGLMMGYRVKQNGTTCLRYKAGKRFDTLTAKQAVECIEGYPIKDIIIIPQEDEEPNQ